MKATKKYLLNKDNNKKFMIYEDNIGYGILVKEVFGVLSGQRLLYLRQLKMEQFEIIEG